MKNTILRSSTLGLWWITIWQVQHSRKLLKNGENSSESKRILNRAKRTVLKICRMIKAWKILIQRGKSVNPKLGISYCNKQLKVELIQCNKRLSIRLLLTEVTRSTKVTKIEMLARLARAFYSIDRDKWYTHHWSSLLLWKSTQSARKS